MVYESDFYTTRRPYTRPTMSSYTVTRLSDDWDTPYSWPVRREFSRILHRPRPHLGIVYTERFLNSRPLTYFDDETKVIRARAGALLKQINMPALKPSVTRLPYSLDSYSTQRHVPYGVPQHIYSQSFYNDPAHLTIGRGHLACVQYAGGRSYPRRKNLYSDENRNIRDEIKFRSYYNRPKHDDPNTLPTGFAWRLLHLPAKDSKPFKLYKHSKTLPQLDSIEIKTDKGTIGGEKNKTIKRYKKHATEPIEDEPVFEDENKYISYKDRPELKEEYLPRKKKTDNFSESSKENTSADTINALKSEELIKEPEPKPQEDVPVKSSETFVSHDDVTGSEKKKKKKKEETLEEIIEKPDFKRTESLIEQKNKLPEPELKEDLTQQVIKNELEIKDGPTKQYNEEAKEILDAAKIQNESHEKPMEILPIELSAQEELQPKVQEIEYNEQTIEKVIEEPVETVSQEEKVNEIVDENNTHDLKPESNLTEPEVNPEVKEKNIEQPQQKEESHKEVNEDIIENETVRESYAAVEDAVMEDTESDNAIIEEIQGGDSLTRSQEALDDSTLIVNIVEESDLEHTENDLNAIVDITDAETTAKYVNKSENDGVSETQVHEETVKVNTLINDGISEVSYTETNTTVYAREETIIQASDTEDNTEVVMPEETESSQDELNLADHSTDEVNVDIQEQ